MSRLIGELRHPINGETVLIYDGFSWPCLFLWFFWYLFKGMWGWAIVSGLTSGFGWLFLPFFANKQYQNHLLKKGYLFTKTSNSDEVNKRIKCPYCAELIKAEAKICRFCGKELDSQAVIQLSSDEIVRRLKNYEPEDFEKFVLEFIKKVENCQDGVVTPRSRDGGIDGIIKRGTLGLSDIYFQAKRWKKPVGSPQIRDFVGALQREKASQGVVVTTSSFTKDAKQESVKVGVKVVLIDGEEIAKLVIENNLQHFIKEVSSSSLVENSEVVSIPGLIGKGLGSFVGGIVNVDNTANGKISLRDFKSIPVWIKVLLGFLIFGLFVRLMNPHPVKNVRNHQYQR